MYDTLSQRFSLLAPSIHAYGPSDDIKRPAVLLFHACNGVRDHIHDYAKQIASQGYRAFVVDSFNARGWDHAYALSFVCTGVAMSGYERSGDVLAAIWGIKQRPDVDPDSLILAGWSHGGWAIMDLMTEALTKAGEARIEDPSPDILNGIKGVFLVYPYMNYPARSNYQNWLYRPKVMAVVARFDYLTPDLHGQGVLHRLEASGVDLVTQRLEATHCFDEAGMSIFGLMVYDRASHQATQEALKHFVSDVFEP